MSVSGEIEIAPGLYLAHGQVDIAGVEPFVHALRAEASPVLCPRLVVIRGHSTDAAQARAMLAYAAKYGDTEATRTDAGKAEDLDLTSLYHRAATELLALPERTWQAWLPKVTELYKRGLLRRGGHTATPPGAIDVDDGPPEHNTELKRAALAIGALRAYDDGPSVHIDLPRTVSNEENAWREVQTNLVRAGYNPGPIDGVPGAKTQAAIRKADPAATHEHMRSGLALLAWARALPTKASR